MRGRRDSREEREEREERREVGKEEEKLRLAFSVSLSP